VVVICDLWGAIRRDTTNSSGGRGSRLISCQDSYCHWLGMRTGVDIYWVISFALVVLFHPHLLLYFQIKLQSSIEVQRYRPRAVSVQIPCCEKCGIFYLNSVILNSMGTSCSRAQTFLVLLSFPVNVVNRS